MTGAVSARSEVQALGTGVHALASTRTMSSATLAMPTVVATTAIPAATGIDVVAPVRGRRLPTSPGRAPTVGAKQRRRDDLWIAVTALVAACFAMPFAQSSWHGAEASSILAVSATVMLAGQRWAIAPVVLAELLLVPTLWPRAFAGGGTIDASSLCALVTLAALVPGVLAMRRAAAALVLVSGTKRTRRAIRATHYVFAAIGVVAAALPLIVSR